LIRAVIDTNVLVSGMLSGDGPPGAILGLTLRGLIMPVFNGQILAEYDRVLHRPRFGFVIPEIRSIIDTIEGIGLETQEGAWPEALPDRDDEKFLVAAAAGDAVLITGNLRDFPAPARRHVAVLSPRQFLDSHADRILPFPEPPTR
jgi:putative PIN family toxin of toxin-antitoxin system